MAANKKAPITVALQNERSPYDGHSRRSYLRSRKPLNAATGTDPLQSSLLHGNGKPFPFSCHLELRASLHHDLAGHFRMDRAVVGIRSCLGKPVRELFVRVHHFGLEHAVCAHGGMRNAITVCPGNCCSDRYGDRLRPKNEIIDFHRHVCRGGLVTCCDAR